METNNNDEETNETPETYDVSFTIDDGTDPVNQASVQIGSTTKTTGSAGGCTFSELEAGTYTVTVSKDGYTTATESITVDETHTSFTISLTASSP